MLILHYVELCVVHNVRPHLACADAVQLEPQQVSHLVVVYPELLPHLATCRAVDDNLFHFSLFSLQIKQINQISFSSAE